jgi:hypothetical protein
VKQPVRQKLPGPSGKKEGHPEKMTFPTSSSPPVFAGNACCNNRTAAEASRARLTMHKISTPVDIGIFHG